MSIETSNPARWLAGILIGSVLTALSGGGGVLLVHERRISAVETRIEDSRQQLDRMERKLDQLLRWEVTP